MSPQVRHCFSPSLGLPSWKIKGWTDGLSGPFQLGAEDSGEQESPSLWFGVPWAEKGLRARWADPPSVPPWLSPASSGTGCVCLSGRGSPRVEEPTAGVSDNGGSPAPTLTDHKPEAGEFPALMVPRLTWAQVAYPYWHQMTSPTNYSLYHPPHPPIHKWSMLGSQTNDLRARSDLQMGFA